MRDEPRFAFVRPPGNSFYRAVSDHKERREIDPVNARRQHENYRYVLGDLVGELVELPVDERFPDSCFTQDTAVIVDGHALMARSGVPTRRGEAAVIERVLKERVASIAQVPPPGTLEGGDVLRLGKRLLVGQSRRTSVAGIDALHEWASPMGYQVVPILVPRGVLHLSTAVSVIDEDLVMGLPSMLEDEAFDSVNTLPVSEPLEACNVVVIGDRVIASGDYPVHEVLEREGFTVHRPDLTEFIRADGGPSCLALFLE